MALGMKASTSPAADSTMPLPITPTSTELPTAIEARRLPFVFVTGYGVQGIPEEFRSRPTLQKPFQMEMLAGMIEKAIGSAAA